MNSKARQLADKFAKINVRESCLKALNDPLIQAQMVDMNQANLYDKGILADGNPTGEYSGYTKNQKVSLGDSRQTPGRIDHITLNDTGEFYASMKVVDKGSAGVVISGDTDKPSGDLGVEFGAVVGITADDKAYLVPAIRELIQADIKAKISA